MRHFLDLCDIDNDALRKLLDDAARMKAAFQGGDRAPLLPGRVLGEFHAQQDKGIHHAENTPQDRSRFMKIYSLQ